MTRQSKILSQELPMMKLLMTTNINLKTLNNKSFQGLKSKMMMIFKKRKKNFNKKREAKNSKITNKLTNL